MPKATPRILGLSTVAPLIMTMMLAAPLAGQASTTRGFHLGFHLQGASLSVEGDDTPDEGGGAGIRVGYGINRIVTLFADLDGAVITVEDADNLSGEWGMAHVDFGGRFHFANSLRRWVPFLEAAVGFRSVGVDDALVNNETVESVSFNGGSFSIGGGLAVYFTETLALDVAARFTAGEFTEIEVGALSLRNLDIDANSGRFNLGLVWWL